MGDTLKRIFEIIGFISLVCFSFFYTNEISNVIKENDDLLIQIKDNENLYNVKAIDAVILDDTIIPGVSGRRVSADKSYNNMKKYNTFNENLLVYDKVKPNVSVNKVYDKYIISGNKSTTNITLTFVLYSDSNIDNIINILNKNEIKATFFVDMDYFDSNNEIISYLIKNNHTIGFLNSSKGNINYMSAVVSKINNQKYLFCFNNLKNSEFLKICSLNNNYSISSNVIDKDYYINVKKNLTNGSILTFKVSSKLDNELGLIINYIKQKGFKIINMPELINE